MRVIQRPRAAGGRVIALGTFDGVHRGHRALLATARSIALDMGIPLRVCTFNRHPLEVLRPQDPPELLSTMPEKALQMYGAGVDEMELLPFDRRTADMEPEEFLCRLRAMSDVRAVVAGWNYSFGRKGRGDAALLEADGKEHGYAVRIEPPATLDDGTVISSSLVRQKLKEGNLSAASELLGYDYSISGTVAAGKHKGHDLGFPTANIAPWKRKALPAYGVYACLLETDTETLPAVANIGVQPTLPSGKVTVEAHILGEDRDLYGRKVRLTLMSMLRGEKRFDSVSALKAQIEKDRTEAMKLFDMA